MNDNTTSRNKKAADFFYKRNLDSNIECCTVILTEPTTPLIFHAQPGGTFSFMGCFMYQYPKQILTMINEKCPGVAINTEEYTTYGFRNCLGCILKNSFSFNGPIISELGKEISTADVYAEYCEEREKVTLDDLKKYPRI